MGDADRVDGLRGVVRTPYAMQRLVGFSSVSAKLNYLEFLPFHAISNNTVAHNYVIVITKVFSSYQSGIACDNQLEC